MLGSVLYILKIHFKVRCQWLMPVILATQETEIRRIEVQSQPRQVVPKTLSQKPLSQKWAGGVAQGVGPEFKPQYRKKKKRFTSNLFKMPILAYQGLATSTSYNYMFFIFTCIYIVSTVCFGERIVLDKSLARGRHTEISDEEGKVKKRGTEPEDTGTIKGINEVHLLIDGMV
jgi:hypothetical protein